MYFNPRYRPFDLIPAERKMQQIFSIAVYEQCFGANTI
jgi:hypothetical protein